MNNLGSSKNSGFGKPRALETIIPGGIAIGILDMLFAFIYYGAILGAPWMRIFQNVAGGLLGRAAAINGGVKTFALGLALHFVVATCIAAVFYLLCRIIPALARYPYVVGPIYGLAAFLGMNYAVIPLSALGRFPGPITRPFVVALIGHMILVGPPVALLAWRSARAHRDDPEAGVTAATAQGEIV